MTAGSDAHGPKQYERGPGFTRSMPSRYLKSEFCGRWPRVTAIWSSGPVLQFEAQTDNGDSALMGDLLSTTNQTDFTVSSAWSATPPGATLRLIVNGALYAKGEVAAEGQRNWRAPVHGTRWCTLELRGDHGAMLAVTNPIFLVHDGRSYKGAL
ncbi:MAG: hypothetical protein R2867_05990 [Caldilineaceae bacterium]